MYAENTTIEKKNIFLDGATLHNCDIRECKLVFSGYMNYSITDCRFDKCSWAFNGPASSTLSFLQMMNNAGAGDMVQNIIKAILNNDVIPGVTDLPNVK